MLAIIPQLPFMRSLIYMPAGGNTRGLPRQGEKGLAKAQSIYRGCALVIVSVGLMAENQR